MRDIHGKKREDKKMVYIFCVFSHSFAPLLFPFHVSVCLCISLPLSWVLVPFLLLKTLFHYSFFPTCLSICVCVCPCLCVVNPSRFSFSPCEFLYSAGCDPVYSWVLCACVCVCVYISIWQRRPGKVWKLRRRESPDFPSYALSALRVVQSLNY